MERSEIMLQVPLLKGIAKDLLSQQKQVLSPEATLNSQAVRRRYEEQLEAGYRQPFSVDTDRIS